MKFFRSAWERVLVQALNFSRFQFLVQDGVADFEKQVKKRKEEKNIFPKFAPQKNTITKNLVKYGYGNSTSSLVEPAFTNGTQIYRANWKSSSCQCWPLNRYGIEIVF